MYVLGTVSACCHVLATVIKVIKQVLIYGHSTD